MKYVKYLMAAISMAAVVCGCATKIDRYTPRGGNSGGGESGGGQPEPEQQITLRENKTWKVTYNGRAEDGSETIVVNNVPSNQTYLLSVINRANYATYVGEDDKMDNLKFFKEELEYNSDHKYTGSPTVEYFDRFRHGTWYAWVIALDANGKLTGEFAYSIFDIDEDEPTPEYLAWIGDWKVTSGNVSYDISIMHDYYSYDGDLVAQGDNNFVYVVRGWEVREEDEDWNQMYMKEDYLETFYEETNDNMYFTSQYIFTYEDDDLKKDVHEFFLGQIDYKGIIQGQGLYTITDEGLDLAYARFLPGNTDKAEIKTCTIKDQKVGDDTFTGPFFNMQYFYNQDNTNKWIKYNESVPTFPFSMERTAAQPKPKAAVRMRGNGTGKSVERPLRGKVYTPRNR